MARKWEMKVEECPTSLCLHMRGSIRDTNIITRNPVALEQILERDVDEFLVPNASDHAACAAFMAGEESVEIERAAIEFEDDSVGEHVLAADDDAAFDAYFEHVGQAMPDPQDGESFAEYLDRMAQLAYGPLAAVWTKLPAR